VGTRVLVVEDEQDIAGLIKHALERKGDIEVDVAGAGDAAVRAVSEVPPDLIVLDLNLPVLSGVEVCRIVRSRPATAHIPIIMLTARASESDRVAGLELGADDYITKPFALRELVARVRAVLRRGANGSAAKSAPMSYAGKNLIADFDAVSVTVDGGLIRLTLGEFELLRLFASNPGRVFPRKYLLEKIWDYSYEGYDRTIDSHINRLRAKIEENPENPQMVLTVWGIGYKFSDEQ
jgi:DNA-binding response OmpR family regulator